MKNILFLTDYSKHSKYSYQYALRIAQHFNSTINFGHVFLPVSPIVVTEEAEDLPYVEIFIDQEYEEETETLKAFAEAQTHEQDQYLLGDFFVRSGNIAAEILGIIESGNIDLVIMGMQQQSKLENALFGNLSLEIIDKAPCPIFLVPKKALYTGINNIVYASDFSEPDLPSFRLLLAWAKAFDATLHVIYVMPKTLEIKASPYVDTLVEAFPKEFEEGLLELQYVEGNVQKEIVQHVKDLNADMVALTKRNRTFWKSLLTPSITEGVIGVVDIPVLVFKRKKT